MNKQKRDDLVKQFIIDHDISAQAALMYLKENDWNYALAQDAYLHDEAND